MKLLNIIVQFCQNMVAMCLIFDTSGLGQLIRLHQSPGKLLGLTMPDKSQDAKNADRSYLVGACVAFHRPRQPTY